MWYPIAHQQNNVYNGQYITSAKLLLDKILLKQLIPRVILLSLTNIKCTNLDLSIHSSQRVTSTFRVSPTAGATWKATKKQADHDGILDLAAAEFPSQGRIWKGTIWKPQISSYEGAFLGRWVSMLAFGLRSSWVIKFRFKPSTHPTHPEVPAWTRCANRWWKHRSHSQPWHRL